VCRVTGLGFFSSGSDGNVTMMDLEGEVVNIFKGNEAAVGSLSYSLETEIVSGCWDGTASVWDVETGKKKDVLSGHKHSVSVLSL
jgi:WD40 repeat protein